MSATLLETTRAEILLTPLEAAAALGVTLDDLEASRGAGSAPTHIELGARTVRYFRAAVEAVSKR